METAAPPTTTTEEDLHSLGQRRINLIWEYTQAVTTLLIVGGNVFAAFVPVISHDAGSTLTNAMFVVLGFYYGRTNHQRVGGVQLGR